MFARVTTFKVDPSRLGELQASIARMRPAAKGLAGVVDIYVVWRGDGQGVVTAIYESRAAADKAVMRIQALWGAFAGLLQGAPRTDIYETVEHVAG
jgi:hypothetical protein